MLSVVINFIAFWITIVFFPNPCRLTDFVDPNERLYTPSVEYLLSKYPGCDYYCDPSEFTVESVRVIGPPEVYHNLKKKLMEKK